MKTAVDETLNRNDGTTEIYNQHDSPTGWESRRLAASSVNVTRSAHRRSRRSPPALRPGSRPGRIPDGAQTQYRPLSGAGSAAIAGLFLAASNDRSSGYGLDSLHTRASD